MTEQQPIQEIDPKFLSSIAQLIRAFEGIDPESETAIKQLIDMKNILERSRFPTYPILARQVYLRLIYEAYPDYAQSCKDWADNEAHGLIQYKGQGRDEFVEMNKNLNPSANQEFYVGGTTPNKTEPKKGLFDRFRKPKDESEFIDE